MLSQVHLTTAAAIGLVILFHTIIFVGAVWHDRILG